MYMHTDVIKFLKTYKELTPIHVLANELIQTISIHILLNVNDKIKIKRNSSHVSIAKYI